MLRLALTIGARMGTFLRGSNGGPGGSSSGDALLLESGDFLLLESGDKILLE